ncbi:type IV secretory system conjugative DNA transfer family protein [Salipiger sp. PrR003]|uniref:type IV secretory system conjugative DNA transfer family protein n=1 Tax=Salipiger sp. PrR003 TaxID=2706776 RepID=UPI0013DC9D8E|nr:type IV secretory system conjugative DNA transfer family protein [Salipiger sp. PrR003]NDV52798.1 TraM recognition domain-containing protein [Salipiger sp. PrR003]
MAEKKVRGLTKEQELNEEFLVRDTRGKLKKFKDWITIPNNMFVLLFMMAAGAIVVGEISEFLLAIAFCFYRWGMKREESTPIKMPIQSGFMDPHQPHPAHGKPTSAKGIFFLGNEMKTGKEVWLTNDDARQHFLVVGTTGAGKAQPLSALVRTRQGFIRMGDIQVGQMVIAADGSEAEVKAIYPQGEIDVFSVAMEDGRSTEACAEHLWTVYVDEGPAQTLSTEHVHNLMAVGHSVSIPLPKAVPGYLPLEVDARAFGARIAGEMALGHDLPGDELATLERLELAPVVERGRFLQGLLGCAISRVNVAYVMAECPCAATADKLASLVRSIGGLARIEEAGGKVTGVSIHLPEGDRAGRAGILIYSIEPAGCKEAQCIYIDHPDHLYVTDDYVVTHNTESLLGFAANALMWGSGFLFCDGKGDVALFAKVYALARRFGREDDLLVLNFMTGNQDLGAMGGKIMSNTLNPFSNGSSDSLTQMVVSLMDDAGGDGAMWKGRATAMLTGVMRALCWLRDEGHVDLNVGEIREFMSLRKIVDLGDVDKYPDMPQPIRKTIKSYLTSLPGFQPEKGYKQAQTTLDQHGYLEMQFTKILGSLADVYGHIFFTPNGEVDMFDVVLNRRILVIMLPALEKSGDEIANLGKIVVATLKGMMGATLGSSLEGSWAQVVENRPTNSPSPFICVLDEVGYYTVEGMALMAAQARSLGFTMVYASQDIPAMKRLNEKEAASIIANTNTKIFMRSEEAETTGKLAVEAGGKGLKAQTGGFQGKSGEFGVGYSDGMDARIEAADRVNWTDLKAQTEGMMHIMFQDKVVRAKSFYANPEGAVDNKKLKLRANHFIKVPKPDYEDLERARTLPIISEKMLSEEFIAENKAAATQAIEEARGSKDKIATAVKVFDYMIQTRQKPTDAGACSVAAIIHEQSEAIKGFHKRILGEEDPEAGADTPASEDDGSTGKRRPIRPRGNPIKRGISHQVLIEGDAEHDEREINMAGDMAASDDVLSALAAVDYDSDTSREQVEKQISDALDPLSLMDDDDMPKPEDIMTSDVDDNVTRAAGSLFDELDDLGVELGGGSEDTRDPGSAEDDGDDGIPQSDDITTHLLSQFIIDDDEDDE